MAIPKSSGDNTFFFSTEPKSAGKPATSLLSRNISVMGHRTSIRLEPEMWQALKDIARRENCSIHAVCSLVALHKRALSSFTAAIRVFVMLYYRAAATEDGHRQAGHGHLQGMLARTVARQGQANGNSAENENEVLSRQQAI